MANYDTGLFGESRLGPGAFYFDPFVVGFSATPTSGVEALSVTFTDLTTGGPTAWLWGFGDDSTSSTDQNPVHVYPIAGVYDVTLSASNTLGSSQVTSANYITVTEAGKGHIGAFYFGPVDGTVTPDIFEVSAVFLQPTITVIDRVSGTVISPIFYVNPVLLQPTVYAFKDITVDYVGVPRAGISPLTVDFTAIVTLSPAMKGKYRVKEYVWCFDYDYDAGTCKIPWVTTTQNPITHVYTGYRGQKFSAKVCVTLELA